MLPYLKSNKYKVDCTEIIKGLSALADCYLTVPEKQLNEKIVYFNNKLYQYDMQVEVIE